MSNASLKEQLQAVASQLSDSLAKNKKPQHHARPHRDAHRDRARRDNPKHAENIQKPKPRWLDYVQYGVELLKVYFPQSFKELNDVKPLKKGIKQDLVKRLSTLEIVTEDKACMVKSLAYYVNTAAYHKSVIEGSTRVDLDGNPSGIVTKEEATYSIERHKAKLLAKKSHASLQPNAKPRDESGLSSSISE